jgi:hypothetical protein
MPAATVETGDAAAEGQFVFHDAVPDRMRGLAPDHQVRNTIIPQRLERRQAAQERMRDLAADGHRIAPFQKLIEPPATCREEALIDMHADQQSAELLQWLRVE